MGNTADHRIWYATLENKNISFDTSRIYSNACEPLLEESLRKSYAGNTSNIPALFAIPRETWAFQTATKNGEFIHFYEGLLSEEPIDAIADYVDSDHVLAKKKKFLKYRLEWIQSQHPGTGGRDGSILQHNLLRRVTMGALILAVAVFSAKLLFCKDDRRRSTYSTVGDAEIE